VHRLDRDTSGVVLVAKDAGTRAALGRDFAGGKVKKIYAAVVRGIPEGTPEGCPREISFPIGKDLKSTISYKFKVDASGKSATTQIIEKQLLGRGHALLTLQPLTGRTHQIRVHLAAIGMPLVGDKLYGWSEQEYCAWRENPLRQQYRGDGIVFHRHALHCASLEFIHPQTKKQCVIEAPLPEDMKMLVETLAKGETPQAY
jgi:23S rRNA pseudouridine1911/1915/1917 synthase